MVMVIVLKQVKNSYTSGWQGADAWGGNVAQDGELGQPVPCHGNTGTMNMNNVLLKNIQTHRFFKEQLCKYTTFTEIVDQVLNFCYFIQHR